MWITERDGKYRAQERYKDPITGRSKTLSVTMRTNSPQSRKKAAEALQTRLEGILNAQTADISLRRLCDLYLTTQKKTVKPSTLARNTYAMNSLCRIIGDDALISKLTAGYIKARLLETGEEPGTMNERIKRLRALLRWAYQNDFIEKDITGKLSVFHDVPHADKIAEKFMTAEEYHAVVDDMDRKDYALLTQFLVLSGLRYGETAALDKADVDIKGRYIHVNKTYDSETKTVTTAKTETSIRRVYIQDALLPICQQINVLMGERKILHGCRSDCFFHDQNGEIIPYFTYAKYLRASTVRTLGRQITPHTLRHTHASLMFEAGVPLEVISRRLGHKNSKVTRDIYVHITEELQRRDNDAIRGISF